MIESSLVRRTGDAQITDGFVQAVAVALAMEKDWNRGCLHQTKSSGILPRVASNENEVAGRLRVLA
jgi:hypothetical protein